MQISKTIEPEIDRVFWVEVQLEVETRCDKWGESMQMCVVIRTGCIDYWGATKPALNTTNDNNNILNLRSAVMSMERSEYQQR